MAIGSSRLGVLSRVLGRWTRRVDERFYVVFAVVCVLFLIADATLTNFVQGLEESTYDKLIRYRLSGPPPSPDIVIVDIDERTLERVGRDLGRWPWPRQTMAEALATIDEAGPRAVFTNVLYSDPDPNGAASDRVLAEIAGASPRLVFSFIRLPPENDGASALKAADIAGSRPLPDAAPEAGGEKREGGATVAAIVPAFAALQANMGAANLSPDKDGIVRTYAYWLEAGDRALPSAAAAILKTAGAAAPDDVGPSPSRLNWRNKQGSYTRISFADLYEAMAGTAEFDWSVFRNRIVIIGPTAPGIAVTRGTPISPVTDDNLILATAIDDAIAGTSLSLLSDAAGLVLAILMIAGLAAAFVLDVKETAIDAAFVAAQAILVAATFVSISYTNVVVDMSYPFNAGLLYFAVARSFVVARTASQKGVSRFWRAEEAEPSDGAVLVASPIRNGRDHRAMVRVRKTLERALGQDSVLHLTDFIDENTFLGEDVGNWEVIIAFRRGDSGPALAAATEAAKGGDLRVIPLDFRGPGLAARRHEIWEALVAGPFRDFASAT